MTLESGKYYAIPVSSGDPDFDVEFNVNPELSVITAQRLIESDKPQTPSDEIEQIKAKAKEGLASIKKGGLKGAFSFAKKMSEEYLKDDKQKLTEKKEAEFKDPMDPINAFALDTQSRVKYGLIHSLEDKTKNTNIYEFRSDSGYGVLESVGEGVFREISFSYPSHEYAEKHYENQSVGHSVHDWRREDDDLHRMRTYFLSQDKAKAETAAKLASMETIKNEYFSVDLTSTRATEKTRFSTPNLKISHKSGELSLNFLYSWFLPRKTQNGRQIQYNWDALRVRVTQGDKLIKRVVCWSNSKETDYVKSQRTNMELMNSGYIGELEAGNYELRVSIYNDEMMVYPFEVVKTVSTDAQKEVETYYSLQTPMDKFVPINYSEVDFSLEILYPVRKYVTEMGSVDCFKIRCEILGGGENWTKHNNTDEYDALFDDWKVDGRNDGDVRHTVFVRRDLGWMEENMRINTRFGVIPSEDSWTEDNRKERASMGGITSAPNGVYTAHISINGVERDQIEFEILDGKLVADKASYIQDIPIADFDFPEEHRGVLHLIKSQVQS